MSLGGGILPGLFLCTEGGGNYAKKTEETVPLSRLSEPYGRRLL